VPTKNPSQNGARLLPGHSLKKAVHSEFLLSLADLKAFSNATKLEFDESINNQTYFKEKSCSRTRAVLLTVRSQRAKHASSRRRAYLYCWSSDKPVTHTILGTKEPKYARILFQPSLVDRDSNRAILINI
jgi:hypothetical protein